MMSSPETLAAIVFYLGIVALAAGAIVAARAAVERTRSRLALPLLALGAVGIAIALWSYLRGPRHMLPF